MPIISEAPRGNVATPSSVVDIVEDIACDRLNETVQDYSRLCMCLCMCMCVFMC